MVAYPVIEQQAGRRWLAEHLEDPAAAGPPPVTESGRGPQLDIGDLKAAAESASSALPAEPKRKDRDAREAEYSVRLYESLKAAPPEVLDDPAFWHFVSLDLFLDLIKWRQPGAFDDGPNTYSRYVDGTNVTECVPLRMYVRGRLAVLAGDQSLATAIEEGTDFWRSHVIRVSTSFSPVLTKALVVRQEKDRLPTSELRQAAKIINRSTSNLLVPIINEGHASGIVDAAWQEQE